MPENLLIPSVDLRVGSLLEYNRQQVARAGKHHHRHKRKQCVTLSREFGCEAFPVAERLRELLHRSSGEEWVIMDKGLLEEVARRHNLSEEVMRGLGEKNVLLDEVLATFSPRWKSQRDYFQLLCSHIISLAEQGNVIIVGRGGAVITRNLENCHHFRLYGSMAFKSASIARRLGIPVEAAEKMIEKRQKQRDRFNNDFLDCDTRDASYYDLLFNNDRCTPDRIAEMIAFHVGHAGER